MRKIKQIDRPFQIIRTMPSGERLFSAEASLEWAKERTDKLPKNQLPAYVTVRRNGAWERVYERNPTLPPLKPRFNSNAERA